MKTKLFLNLFAISLGILKAQVVNIPDANFKAILVGSKGPNGINTNGDNEVQVSEATAYTGQINCNSANVADLTGIETFVNIKTLQCGFNKLTSLDVSKNIALETLVCYTNRLTNLDISKNGALKVLRCDLNQLTKLNLKNGNNVAITTMAVQNNPNLTCIQVDNAVNANSYSGWTKDTTANYSAECSYLSTTDVNKKGVTFYPSPVKSSLYFSEALSNIQILDMSGKIIHSQKEMVKKLSVEQLPKGNYIISTNDQNGKIFSQKFIKE